MTVKLKEGTGPAKVYNALLSHEYMSKPKIAEKSGVAIDSLSGALTKLRRAGLAAHNEGTQKQKMWKKFPQTTPMYPPQADSRKRKQTEKTFTKELPRVDTLDEIIDRMITDFTLLRDVVQQQNEQCKVNEEKLKVLQKVFQQ